MYVRWQYWHQRKRRITRYYWQTPADAHAILVESSRVDGKPKQRHIAYLGSAHGHPDVHYRAWWWHHMTAKLDQLGNRIGDARPKIEAALAEKVPPVTAVEVTAFDLQHQEKIRADRGECRGCYYSWPPGQDGVPPRPAYVDDEPDFSKVLAAVTAR
jgi:hypothetical protein